MAATKISDMTAGTTPASADEFPVARAGTNVKLTYEQIKDAVIASDEAAELVTESRWFLKAAGTDYATAVATLDLAAAPNGASNTTPVVIVTTAAHKLKTGQRVHVAGVVGNTAANSIGDELLYVDANTVELVDATNTTPIVFSTFPVRHNLAVNDVVRVEGVKGNTAANNTNATTTWTVATVTSPFLFTCTGCNGNAAYDAGGTVSWGTKFKLKRLNNPTRVAVTNATNATPIVITTGSAHGFTDFDRVIVQGVAGNTAANNTGTDDTWQINVTGASTFELTAVAGNGIYTGGGCVELAFANTLVDVAGNGAHSSGGTVKIPGRVTLANCATEALAIAKGFEVGIPIRLKYSSLSGLVRKGAELPKVVEGATNASPIVVTATAHGYSNGDFVHVFGVTDNTNANGTFMVAGATANTFQLSGVSGNGDYATSTKTIYGLIVSIPDYEGYPYTRGGAVAPDNQANELTYAGPPLLGAITQLAIGNPEMVSYLELTADALPYYGAESELPLSQLIQNTPSNIVDKWRMTGGGTVLGVHGNKYKRWMGPNAFVVGYAIVHREPATTFTSSNLFSGTTVTITADADRPYNSDEQHTDGYPGKGSLVTRASSTFPFGEAYTGLRGWTFRKATTKHWDVSGATNASPIVITTSETHNITNGQVVIVHGVLGNTAANGTWTAANVAATTLELATSVGNGAYIADTGDKVTVLQNVIQEESVVAEGGFGIEQLNDVIGASNTTPITITTKEAHGLTTGCKVTVFGVAGNTAANVTANAITKTGATTFTLDATVGNGTFGGYSAPVAITGATNAAPIVVTAVSHGFSNNDIVRIEGVVSNTNANGVWMVKNQTANTFELYDPVSGTATRDGNSPYGGGGTATKAGGFVKNGLGNDKLVIESLTMEGSAGTYYELHDFQRQPRINVDLGGQLVSPHAAYAGLAAHRIDNLLVFLPASEINAESYDLVLGSRLEIACTSVGNRPGVESETATGRGGAEFLSCFLFLIHE